MQFVRPPRRDLIFYTHSQHRQQVLLMPELYGILRYLEAINAGKPAKHSAHIAPLLQSPLAEAFFQHESSSRIERMVSGAYLVSKCICKITTLSFRPDQRDSSTIPLGIGGCGGTGFMVRELPNSIVTNSHVMAHHFALLVSQFSFYVIDEQADDVRWVDVRSPPGTRCIRMRLDDDEVHGAPDLAVITFPRDSKAAQQLKRLRQGMDLPSIFAHYVDKNKARRMDPADIDAAAFRLPRKGERVSVAHYAGVSAEHSASTFNELGELPQVSLYGRVVKSDLRDDEAEAEDKHFAAAKGKWRRRKLPDGQQVWSVPPSELDRTQVIRIQFDGFSSGGASGSPVSDHNGEVIGLLYAGNAKPPLLNSWAVMLTKHVRDLLYIMSWMMEPKPPADVQRQYEAAVNRHQMYELSPVQDEQLLHKYGIQLTDVYEMLQARMFVQFQLDARALEFIQFVNEEKKAAAKRLKIKMKKQRQKAKRAAIAHGSAACSSTSAPADLPSSDSEDESKE